MSDIEPIVKRVWFQPYQYRVTYKDTTYHVRQLHVHRNHILTINSKYVWNIKTGSVKGLQFTTRGSHLIDMRACLSLSNPIVVLKQRPYKILQYLNESDIVDISSTSEVHGVPLFTDLNQFLQHLKQSER